MKIILTENRRFVKTAAASWDGNKGGERAMGGDLNKIHQLRIITEYCPPDYQPIVHPNGVEMMDKLNECIKMINFIVEHYIDEKNE